MIPGNAHAHPLSSAQKINADMIVMDNGIRGIWLRKVWKDAVLKTLTRSEHPIFLSQ